MNIKVIKPIQIFILIRAHCGKPTQLKNLDFCISCREPLKVFEEIGELAIVLRRSLWKWRWRAHTGGCGGIRRWTVPKEVKGETEEALS